MPGDVITGSVIAFKGQADLNGVFHVDDFTFAGYFQEPKFRIPTSIRVRGPPRELLDTDLLMSDRKFVIFISGLEIGRE